jgi:Uma2 family endonuclease
LVLRPAAAFIPWDRLPGGTVPDVPLADFIPALVVEVPAAGNTAGELKREREEYFKAGVRLVWVIRAPTQTAEEWTSPTDCRPIEPDGSLDGAAALPGFTQSLKDLFARTARRKKSP